MSKNVININKNNKKEKIGKSILKRELNWFKLDNAALIYPAISTNKWNSVYRVSAILKNQVEPEVLNEALKDVIKRFPHLNVSLKNGLFWFYFQEIATIPKAKLDDDYPCKHMEFKHKEHLFRILYYNKRVSFEAFHSLTDGYGAVVFLNTLLSRYFDLLGNKINKKDYAVDYLDKPTAEELEDSFDRYADLKTRNPWGENKAYQLMGTREDYGKLILVNGIMKGTDVKTVAKEHNATVTEFLISVLAKTLAEHQKIRGSRKKPVKVSMPIDLRRIFGSKSLRNFSSYMNMEIKTHEKDLSLEDIILKVKEYTKKIDKNYVMGNINANVKAQKNIFMRVTPLFIKKLVLKIAHNLVGEKIVTMTMSNVGIIKAPEEFKELVNRYEVNVGASKLNAMTATCATYNDNLVFTFSSTIKETDFIRDYFRKLTAFGIKIKIESNLS
jgi:NRPS condensation-like uncharacterized protein